MDSESASGLWKYQVVDTLRTTSVPSTGPSPSRLNICGKVTHDAGKPWTLYV